MAARIQTLVGRKFVLWLDTILMQRALATGAGTPLPSVRFEMC